MDIVEPVSPLTIPEEALKVAIEAIVVSDEVRQMISEVVHSVISEYAYPKATIDEMVAEREKKLNEIEKRVDLKVGQSADDFKNGLNHLGAHIETQLSQLNAETKKQIEDIGRGFTDQVTQLAKHHRLGMRAIRAQRQITERWNEILENQQSKTERIESRVEKHSDQIDEIQTLHFDVEERGKGLARELTKQGDELAALKDELTTARNAQIEDVKKIYAKMDELGQNIEPMRIIADQTLKRQESFKKGANIIWNLVLSRAGAAALGGSGIAKFVTDHQETIRQFLFGG